MAGQLVELIALNRCEKEQKTTTKKLNIEFKSSITRKASN